MKFIFFLSIYFYSILAFSKVRVAFFEAYYRDGRRVELTTGGLYFHVAIEAGGKWYHTSPKEGVTTLTELKSQPGMRLVEVLEHEEIKITYKDIKPYLHQKFDYTYNWDSRETTYCSKFIAQLLDIKPKKMSFASPHWNLAKNLNRSGLGISPDDLFEALIHRGFQILPLKASSRKKRPHCRALFK